MSGIRVRFAPSPTGPLHIGGMRTALFNYLFARKNKGKFILRIEDTDQNRFVPGAEQYILDAFEWCGIEIDEGVNVGGAHEPYRQSERKEIYRKHVDMLLEKGLAYYAFDTPGELESKRNEAESRKETFAYDAATRMVMRNSLTMDTNEVDEWIKSGKPHVIRLKMPENETVEFDDMVRDHVKVNTSTLDDKVLFKSDGLPTYHLANVVDDHLMEISHVIRGEEWLPSTPLHVLLYQAFGWKMPLFAHMPLTLKPSGQGKLSKRDGDKLGFPVFPLEWTNPGNGEKSKGYKEDGYFPAAFVNILALLGWNPGTEKEIFYTMNDLISEFSIDHIGKSGSRFDPEKAKWINQKHLQHMSSEGLWPYYNKVLHDNGVNAEKDKALKIIDLVKERAVFPADLWEQSFYFFLTPQQYDPKVVKKRWKEHTPAMMQDLLLVLKSADDFSSASLEEVVKSWIEEKELGMGQVMNAFRLALVGASMGPHLFDICELIGKEETLLRVEKAINEIKR